MASNQTEDQHQCDETAMVKHSSQPVPVLRPSYANPRNYSLSSTISVTPVKINKFCSTHHFMRIWRGYPLRIYGQILIQHFLEEKDFICPLYVNLCANYLYNVDDEIHELAFVLSKAFKASRKVSITRNMLLTIIEKWEKFGYDKNEITEHLKKRLINQYFEQLLSKRYLVDVGHEFTNLYQLSMEAKIGFGTSRR